MRKFLGISLAAILAVSALYFFVPSVRAALQNYGEIMDTNMAVYFKFNDATTTNSSASNARAFSNVGLTFATSSGRFGQGAVFNGTTAKFQASSSISLNGIGNGDWTISMWLNPTSPAGAQNTVLFTRTAGGGPIDIELYLNVGSNGGVTCFQTTAAGASVNIATSGVSLATSSWSHVGCVRKKGVNDKLYINGNLVKTVTDDNGSYARNQAWCWGKDCAFTQFYSGSMDDFFAIKGTAWTDQQMRNYYNQTRGFYGPQSSP